MAIRWHDSKNFLSYIAGMISVSVVIVSLGSWFFLSRFFSNFEAYLLANTGAALAAVFTCGLYAFLGPVTADRSFAVQMVMFLYKSKRPYSRQEIIERLDTSPILEKRYEECMRAKIMKEENGQIILTKKGRRVGWLYALIFDGLNLSNRSQYKNYFSLR